MKAMDLLKYMEMADPGFVEEASDRNVLLSRKRRKRTRTALAACLALVVLAGVAFAKPALYAWETRNTVTSWTNTLSGDNDASCPVYVSAEMPDQKKFSADTPFTLSVGLGQISDYEYATLSVNAEGFEITDKDGNTVTDRYVRTFSDFNGGEYGMVTDDRHNVTGCAYLEDFTFRYTGEDGSGVIELRLMSRDPSSTMGDGITLYYTVTNGVLKMTDKRPRDNWENGTPLTEETVPSVGTLTQDNVAVSVRMETSVLTPGMRSVNPPEISARIILTGKDYPTDSFTAELVYAETLRKKDFSFTIKTPVEQTENGAVYFMPVVPDDAPIGAYDLVLTDGATDFVWVFENFALVLPPDVPAYEDFIFEAGPNPAPVRQGDDDWGFTELFTLTENGEDVAFFAWVELQYAGDEELDYSITLQDSGLSSPVSTPYFVPADAPVGWYDLVVTYDWYGYTWRVGNFIEILENPDAPRFGLYHSIEKKLTVSRSSNEIYTFVAKLENRGAPLHIGEGESFVPKASLVMQTNNFGFIPEILLKADSDSHVDYGGVAIRTGQTGSMMYELILEPDTPCGVYDLSLSYGDCFVRFVGVVEVVP